MKIFKVIKHTFTLVCIVFAAVSCDEEFTSIESNVVGDDNFNFDTPRDVIDIVAYNANIEAQQINNLPSYLLGYFNDPVYGATSASIVTQVSPETLNPDFGSNPEVTSVILTIPYFSTAIGGDSANPIFRLDSLFVQDNNIVNLQPINLSIHENTFFLRDFDPNSTDDTENYFSRANQDTSNNLALLGSQEINFDDNIGHTFIESQSFEISNAPRAINSEEADSDANTTTILEPAFQIDLAQTAANRTFWQEKLFNSSNTEALSNLGLFETFFRGLYIKAEALNGTGSMVLLNFLDPGANIIINYTNDETVAPNTLSYRLNFTGNRLNTFINNFTSVLPVNADTTNGDPRIYLKGTEGAIGVIELFDDTTLTDCNCGTNSAGAPIVVRATALECFKKTYRKTDDEGNILPQVNGRFELKRLINEAQILIYEDATRVSNAVDANGEDYHTHDRLYIYNLDTNGSISDYDEDPTPDDTPTRIARSFSSSLRTTFVENGERVSRYRLRVTDHLNDILFNDFPNPKLGLVSTNNINIAITAPLGNSTENSTVTEVPFNTVITPRGTVLVGSNTNDANKRMRLEIFSTEPRS